MVLKHHPKWGTVPDLIENSHIDSTVLASEETQHCLSETTSSDNSTPKEAAPKPESFAGGSRRANIARQKEVRTQAVR